MAGPVGVQVPVQRKILYPPRPGPPLSVEDAHARDMVEVPVGVATSEEGVVGPEESMVIEVVAVEVPFGFVAERVYTMVLVGLTVVEPIRVEVERPPYPVAVMATDEALLTFQERVDVPEERTTEGKEEKEEMAGVPGARSWLSASNVATATSLFPPMVSVPPYATDAVLVATTSAYSPCAPLHAPHDPP